MPEDAMGGYFSYGEQSRHYFDRPHERPAPEPVSGPAAWRNADMTDSARWRVVLTRDQVEELRAAVAHACGTGRALGELRTVDFPLPRLEREVARWREEIEGGRGFQVVSGLPVREWSEAEASLCFWCLGLHMGRPGAQNPQGDLLGHVRDTGADARDPFVRLYRTASNIAYHCDAADVVGLLCLSAAKSGGASRIVSSVAVHDELVRQRPDLAARLYRPFLLDIRNEDASGALRYLPIPPCRFADGRLRTFYHSDYFRSVVRHADVPAFSNDERELLDLYEALAARPDFFLDMDLAPGDIQWLSNHTILHARTAYEDHPEPERKRHLLRLWLSIGPEG
jgi:Taurine catabolism dioxygenase TauD, TfdA family